MQVLGLLVLVLAGASLLVILRSQGEAPDRARSAAHRRRMQASAPGGGETASGPRVA